MTKHEHIRSELADMLETIGGLTVVTAMTSGQEPARPFARLRNVGWQREGMGEKASAEGGTICMVEVYIQSGEGTEGLEAERDRLDELIEHTVDTYSMESFSNDHYVITEFIHEYKGASGVLDRNDDRASFVATVSVEWQQTLTK